jgi:DNA-binding IclR family transcriptional regulator
MPKVLTKTLNILECFLKESGSLSLKELVELTGYNVTTTSRICSELVKRGYLSKPKARANYSLGTKFVELGGKVVGQISIRDKAMPFLSDLATLANETVTLTSCDGKQGIHVAVLHSENMLQVVPKEWTVFSRALYCTGVGKIMLAEMDEEELAEFAKTIEFRQFTPNTITTVDDLKKHLLIVKREGVAFDDEEQTPGVRNVAAPVRNYAGELVAIVGVLGASVRLTRSRMREITPAVKNCAQYISEAIGYRPS